MPDDPVGAFVGAPRLLDPGASRGPLVGLTFAVKDLVDVAGTVTGAGNPDFARGRAPAAATAPAVARLLEAGAALVGKTVTDELAYSLSGTNVHWGTPTNAAAPGRITGGSSAGSAAAVAAALVPLAVGTDTGGSIRVPASFCGIVGWRPTHGSVPLAGVVPLSPSFDTLGLLGRDPRVVREGAVVLLADVGSPSSAVPITRLVLASEGLLDLEDGLTESLRDAVRDVARRLGCELIEAEVGLDLLAASVAFRARQSWEAWASHGDWISRTQPGLGPGIRARFEAGSRVTSDEVAAADEDRRQVSALVAELTAEGTALVLPAAPCSAPAVDQDRASKEAWRDRALRLTAPAGLAGAPSVVLPLAHDQGRPLGVAVVGAPGTDLRLLDLAVAALA